MKTCLKYILFLLIILLSPANANAQLTWGLQNTLSGLGLNDIHFVSTNVGWACGTGSTVLKTTDGGENWFSQYIGPISADLKSIYFIDEQKGWAVGNSGVIIKTVNGGATWTGDSYGGGNFEDVFFYDNMFGMAVGDNGSGFSYIYKTTDGGAGWTQVTMSIPSPLFEVQFVNLDTGWVTGNNVIYKTIDGGGVWANQTGIVSGAIESIDMISINEGWVCSSNGQIYHTTNGGSNWAPQTSGVATNLWDIDFIDSYNGIAVGMSGTVVATTDGGVNWVNETGFTGNALYGVYPISTNLFWVCGYNGEIWRSPLSFNDLVILDFVGYDTVCNGVIYNGAGLAIQNIGGTSINEAYLVAINGVDTVGTLYWNGSLAAGATTNVYFFDIQVNGTETYIVTIYGDSVDNNNTFVKTIIGINPSDYYSLNGPFSVCSGDDVELIASGTNIDVFWDNTSTDTFNLNQIVSSDSSLYYTVEIDIGYCKVFDSVFVEFSDCGNSVTAFSPNNDGINDFFFLEGLEGTENIVQFFNRWGDYLTEIINYDNVNNYWDGNWDDGFPMVSGTYYYTVQIPSENKKYSGWVQLLR